MKKLVRDLIPEVIPKDRISQYKFTVVSDSEYKQLLGKKLIEEVQEFLEAENEEELADILEVLDAFISLKGFDKETISKVKGEKLSERGGFFNRILMEKLG